MIQLVKKEKKITKEILDPDFYRFISTELREKGMYA